MKHVVAMTTFIVGGIISLAQANADSGLEVTGAWSRATPGAVTTGVVYLTISDKGRADVLTGLASTPIASGAELHETKTVNGVTRMGSIESLPVDKTKTIKLVPGGYHMMLMGLKQPLKAGDHFPLTLHFKNAGDITTTVTVQSLGSTAPQVDMSGMDMGKM